MCIRDRRTGDPFTEAFAARERNDLIPAILRRLHAEYSQNPQPNQQTTE